MKRLILIAMVVLLSAPTVLAQNFCQGDFNYNGSVGAEDVSVFLVHFGRSQFNNPCPPDGPAPVPKTWQTTSYGTGMMEIYAGELHGQTQDGQTMEMEQ